MTPRKAIFPWFPLRESRSGSFPTRLVIACRDPQDGFWGYPFCKDLGRFGFGCLFGCGVWFLG